MDPTHTAGEPQSDPTAAAAAIADGTTQPQSAPTTPPAGAGTSDAGFETPFNINDVPEAHRPYVEAYQKQLQGAFTRKTQEIAAERARYEQANGFYERLNAEDESERDAAIRELLKANGWDTGDEPEPQYEDTTEQPGYPPTEDPRITELQARLDARDQADQAQATEQYFERVRDTYNSAVDEWAGRNGYAAKDGSAELPEHIAVTLQGIVRGLPPVVGEDGREYPDMATAITYLDANQAAYLTSKDVPAPNVGAVTAQPGFNPRSDKERLAKSLEIAGRHF
jgi:hypothetical protein